MKLLMQSQEPIDVKKKGKKEKRHFSDLFIKGRNGSEVVDFRI